MRVKVTKRFRDKNTRKLYRVGEELEISDERVDEINSTPAGVLVEKVFEQPPLNKTGTEQPTIPHPSELDREHDPKLEPEYKLEREPETEPEHDAKPELEPELEPEHKPKNPDKKAEKKSTKK